MIRVQMPTEFLLPYMGSTFLKKGLGLRIWGVRFRRV